jgi:hypothetical protein
VPHVLKALKVYQVNMDESSQALAVLLTAMGSQFVCHVAGCRSIFVPLACDISGSSIPFFDFFKLLLGSARNTYGSTDL